jgi:hypothetical protein
MALMASAAVASKYDIRNRSAAAQMNNVGAKPRQLILIAESRIEDCHHRQEFGRGLVSEAVSVVRSIDRVAVSNRDMIAHQNSLSRK